MASCLCGKGKRRERACTVIRVIHEDTEHDWQTPRSWALVRFDGFDRVYVKKLENIELIRPPTRIRNGRPAA